MASVAEATATMVRTIEASTGCTMTEWIRRARGTGFGKHGEILNWLKQEHRLGHGYANCIPKAALAPDDASPESLVAAQYSGKKSALLSLYEALILDATAPGHDVAISPKKNNVSIRRAKQFALAQPSPADRIDVGLVLKVRTPTERLEASGEFQRDVHASRAREFQE